jgi:hypothetical protein
MGGGGGGGNQLFYTFTTLSSHLGESIKSLRGGRCTLPSHNRTLPSFLNRGVFWIFFLYVLYSIQHCFICGPSIPGCRGCWDQTQDYCDFGIGSQMLDSVRSHPHSAKSHQHSARSHPHSVRSHPFKPILSSFSQCCQLADWSAA